LFFNNFSLLRMACPFDTKYVVFCPICKTYIREEITKVDEGFCPTCQIDIGVLFLAKGHGRFITLPLQEQLQNYLGHKDFKSVLRVFSFMKHGKCTGPVHRKIFRHQDFDLNMGIDAAEQTKDGSKTIYPLVFFLNNLPLNLQHR
jgi:hypothetical protein